MIKHIISKCQVCTINDMQLNGWCSVKCPLRDYLLKNNSTYKTEVKCLNIKTDNFIDIVMDN